MRYRIISMITMVAMVISLAVGSNEPRMAIDELANYCASNHWSAHLLVEMHAFSPATRNDAPFMDAVSVVSNSWQLLIADWGYYGTNSEMAIMIPHLAGFAGTNAWIGIWTSILDIHDANASICPVRFISEVQKPAGTPLEHFAHKNYSLPVISNLLLRTWAVYPKDDLSQSNYFSSIFSGEYKQELEFEENWNNVSFEYANGQLTNSLSR